MIIMPYYDSGDLIHYISSDFYKINWFDKLRNLCTIAKGLINIHSVDIIHRDLHSGNIFFGGSIAYIGDLGISKSATESTDNKENYGIIPYMAPEIFQGQKYIKASDIYSFGMIMWEFMTGRRPFWDRNHDIELIIDICDGLRPPIVTNAPDGYIELMKECRHSDPDKRSQATDLYERVDKIYSEEPFLNPTEIICSLDIGPVKTNHWGAIYKSRPLSGMINSAMSLRSLRSQSIDLEKIKRKFEDDSIVINKDNGIVLTQLQIKFLKIYKTLRINICLLKNKLRSL
jgi:serine/threonine protein kinase